jgi:hypothetical protein
MRQCPGLSSQSHGDVTYAGELWKVRQLRHVAPITKEGVPSGVCRLDFGVARQKRCRGTSLKSDFESYSDIYTRIKGKKEAYLKVVPNICTMLELS